MKLPIPVYLMLLIAVSACQSSVGSMEDVQGVWIEAGFSFEKASDALIIKDSTVTYYPWGPQRYRSPLMVEDDRVLSFGPHWEKQSIFTRKFTLAEKDLDTTKFLYCDLLLQVTIPTWSTMEQNSIDLRDSVRFYADLSIGRLKKDEFARRPLVSADSVCIQVYDVLISDDDLSRYIRDQLSILQEIDRRDLTFVLHADSPVPDSFFNSVRRKIARVEDSRVVRAYWDDEAKIVRWAEW